MSDHCYQCRFWKDGGRDGDRVPCRDGQCRRRAPVVMDSSQNFGPCWPNTSGADWCGDFQPDALTVIARAKEANRILGTYGK